MTPPPTVARGPGPAAFLRRMMLTSFGLGLIRPAPGTWASIPPLVLVLGLVGVIGPHWTIDVVLALLAALFTIACIRFGREAEAIWGRKDPNQVVADEVAGQSIALLFVPWIDPGAPGAPGAPGPMMTNVSMALLAFGAFRFFDIVKPPPARQLQALPRGWGIVVDDLIAGLFAMAVTQAVVRVVLAT